MTATQASAREELAETRTQFTHASWKDVEALQERCRLAETKAAAKKSALDEQKQRLTMAEEGLRALCLVVPGCAGYGSRVPAVRTDRRLCVMQRDACGQLQCNRHDRKHRRSAALPRGRARQTVTAG